MSIIKTKKTDDIYQDLSQDIETRFYTSNYELDKPLTKRKNKKSNWINKRWISWTNHDRICWIKSKNLYLFNRWL